MTIINFAPIIPPNYRPVTNVQPFTYRDGLTYLEILERLRRYISRELVPWIEGEIKDGNDATEELINGLIAQFNTLVDQIINSSIELQEPVMSEIINDPTSQVRTILNDLYASKTAFTLVQDTVNSHTSTIESVQDTVNDHSVTIAELVNRQDASIPGFQKLVTDLERGIGNRRWVHIGDSLSAQDWTYIRRVAVRIAEMFPKLRVTYVKWADGSGWIPDGEIIQWGSGDSPQVLTVYNLSVSGKGTGYVQGGFHWNAVTDLKPHAISISHGHNEPTNMASVRSRMLGLVEALRAELPFAELVIVGQPPHRDNDVNTNRSNEYSTIARWTGVGFADMTTAFLTHPNMAILFPSGDPVHPNGAGVAVEENIFIRQFWRNGEISAQVPSGLSQVRPNLLPVGTFIGWAGTGVPAGFTRTSGVTLTKEVADFETGGFAVKAVGAGVSQYLAIQLNAATARNFRGRLITVAARIKVLGTSPNVGQASIADGITTVSSGFDPDAGDNWRWAVAQLEISPVATYMAVTINITGSGATTGTVLIDRIVTCLGLPHDTVMT